MQRILSHLPSPRRNAWALLLLLLIHAYYKAERGLLAELLWACFPAALLLAIGVLLRMRWLSGCGFLFHLAIALPAYLLHLVSSGDTNWTSFCIHLLAPLLGWQVWHGQRLPAVCPLLAALLFVGMALLAFLFTPAALNINLAFHAWQPLAVIGTTASHILNALLLSGLLVLGWLGFNSGKKAVTADRDM